MKGRLDMSVICPECKGNGYITVYYQGEKNLIIKTVSIVITKVS
jgi:hypothetical protein